jgi:hypothetical protein
MWVVADARLRTPARHLSLCRTLPSGYARSIRLSYQLASGSSG